MISAGRLPQVAMVGAVAGVVAFGSLAAPASASIAQLIDVVVPADCRYVPPGGTCQQGSATALLYQAGPDEANRVRVAGNAQEARVSDPAAIIEPGNGCSSIDSHTVSCRGPGEFGVSRVFVATGSGADTVSSAFAGSVLIDGGRGDDVLVGGPSGGILYAGQGDDVVRGGDGPELLHDASPRHPVRDGDVDPFHEEAVVALTSPGRGRDSFDGGKGRDRISYEGRSVGVRVDLDNPTAIGGARRERDFVKGVESAVGGAGDDRLAGNDRRVNELDGGEGDDRIVGRRGADHIEGGSGRNVIIAGPGNDYINSPYRPSDYGAERIFCGPGFDNVSWIFPSDFLNDDCEDLEFNFLREGGLFGGSVTSLLPLRRGGTRVVLVAPELWCYFGVNPSGCRLRLDLLVNGPGTRRGTAPARGTLLGSRSYKFSADERKSVSLGLSATGAKILRRHRTLRVRIRVTEGAPHQPGGYLTVLRSP